MRANDIFISYSTKNQDIALEVRRHLEDHAITCWMAPESIPAGSNYTKEIPYGILYSKIAVLILSEDALRSVWVNQEVSYLLNANHIVIPYLADHLDINSDNISEPFNIVVKQSCPIKHTNNSSLDDLLLAIQHQLGRITTFKLPDNSDDLLQLGLQDIVEDGGLLSDNGKAEFYLTKSAELGNTTAMRHLALLLTDIKDVEDARPWWEKAAQSGDVQAQIHEAYYWANKSKGTNQEQINKAVNWLEQAVKEKIPEAMFLLSDLLITEGSIHFNAQRSISLLEQLLSMGHLKAAWNLGNIYNHGIGIKEDAEKAFQYYKVAADDPDDVIAAYSLAECYFNGYGTIQDYERAFELYKEYCTDSDEFAERCGDCWINGWGTKRNKKKAIDAYSKAGIFYYPEDNLESEIIMRFIQKLVKLGSGLGESALGKIHLYQGDCKKAFKLFARSAKHGDSDGIIDLAKCYYYGHGVTRNYQSAFLLFSKAFFMKRKEVYPFLGECYEKGRGVKKDQVKADYFYNIANQHGFHEEWELSVLNSKKTNK